MFYILYLIGMMILLFAGMTFDLSYGVVISAANLLNFWDIPALLFMLSFCALALFCTKYFRAFGNAVLFACGKKKLTRMETAKALLSVKTVMLASLLSGGLLWIIGLVNGFHQLSEPSAMAILIVRSLLAMGYALVICLALLPVVVLLKQSAFSEDGQAPAAHVTAVKSRRSQRQSHTK